jgi:hypothetical protein
MTSKPPQRADIPLGNRNKTIGTSEERLLFLPFIQHGNGVG